MLIGNAPALLEVSNAARIVAATDATTLILGESGTGKELFAKAIQENSPRADGPFISVNCAALPENLAESLLFGHRKGAFTSATSDHDGYIRAASGGTLFLDEIAELPLAVQAALLRFLETAEVLPVGASRSVSVDVRLIAATHQDLYQLVQAGRFREDLYYRLNVVPLQLPPLRERSGDISMLLEHFLAQFAARHNVTAPRVHKQSLQLLKQYRWPGNVRELRNLCERLTVLLPGREIMPENLPHEMRASGAVPLSNNNTVVLPGEGVVLADVEVSLIRQALERTGGNRTRAARLLGITRDTLLYRLKKFSLT